MKYKKQLNNIWHLNELFSQKIIQVFYWVGLVMIVLGGIASMFDATTGFTFGTFIKGILFIVLSAVFIRWLSEMSLVAFKINDSLAILAKSAVTSTATKEPQEPAKIVTLETKEPVAK